MNVALDMGLHRVSLIPRVSRGRGGLGTRLELRVCVVCKLQSYRNNRCIVKLIAIIIICAVLKPPCIILITASFLQGLHLELLQLLLHMVFYMFLSN